MRDVRLFLSLEHLEALARVINWLNFSIVSQGRGRLRRGRDGEWPVEQSEHAQHLMIKFPSFTGEVRDAQNNYNSNIKDHGSQITITNTIVMKKFEIL